MYSIRSNVFDITNLAESAFDVVFEPVDENDGDNLAGIDFYVSLRRGTNLTYEVFLKNVDASVFANVPEPTYSDYKRGTIRITANEVLTALQTITTDPDGDGTDTNGNGKLGDDVCPKCVPLKGLASFNNALLPNDLGSAFQPGDVINFRWEMIMKNDSRISATNPQTSVNPDYANYLTSNSSANITTGQFYSSPFVYPITVRTFNGGWSGNFSLKQLAIWSPNHSLQVHQESWPSYLSEILFPDQTVALAKPTNGLSTEREFSVNYRGQTTTMRINFELTRPGLDGTGNNSTGQPSIDNTLVLQGGFPATSTDNTAGTTNLGTVYVALQNSTADCTTERELYWTMPASGTFGNALTVSAPPKPTDNPTASNFLSSKPLLPQNAIPNRGTYRWDGTNGTNTNDTFSIAVDDDCDEYGRRNGYCTWTRRVYLILQKL
jgi:hypothetical protein